MSKPEMIFNLIFIGDLLFSTAFRSVIAIHNYPLPRNVATKAFSHPAFVSFVFFKLPDTYLGLFLCF